MLTISGLGTLCDVTPPSPSKGFDAGIWYALVVIAVCAFIVFYVVKRIADIAVKRKTDTLIRDVGEDKSSDDNEETTVP